MRRDHRTLVGGDGAEAADVFVKVCGLRDHASVSAAVAAGADAVGFVLSDSVRQVSAALARQLVAESPASVLTVAVFGGTPVSDIAAMGADLGVDAIQLHGDYPATAFARLRHLPVQLIRATSVSADTDLTAGGLGEDLLLLDSPRAGSGQRWDLSPLATRRPRGRWLLAGGLHADNVGEAVARARPWGVDVSSGVESSRGVKDPGRIRQFLAAAKVVHQCDSN